MLALGGGAYADGDHVTIFGNNANVKGSYSSAFGESAKAEGDYGLALGAYAKVTGRGTAIGAYADAGNEALAVGNDSKALGLSSVAVGQMAQATAATASAFGKDAHAGHEGSLALGASSTTSARNEVSFGNAALKRRLVNLDDAQLGADSSDAVTGRQLHATNEAVAALDRVSAQHGSTLSEHGRDIAGNQQALQELKEEMADFNPDLEGVVMFNADRTSVDVGGARITGVAAGDISASSTDAVTGAQLFATNSRVGELESRHSFFVAGTDGDSTMPRAGLLGVAAGDGADAAHGSEGATAIGAFATAEAKNSVALGRASHVDAGAEDGFALGSRTDVAARGGVAIGAESVVDAGATGSVAIGHGAVATDSGVVSFGNDVLQRRLVNVARGTAGNDATIVAQLDEALAAFGGGAALDADGKVIAPHYTMQRGQQRTVGDALDALDGAIDQAGARVGAVEQQLGLIFEQGPSVQPDGPGRLSLVGANGMVLSNLADGRVGVGSRDAINGGQLHAVQQRLDRRIDGLEQRVDGPGDPVVVPGEPVVGQEPAPSPPTSPQEPSIPPVPSSSNPPEAQKAPVAQVDTAELEKLLARANEYTDGAISNFEHRLDRMDKRFNRMAAMGSAQSAMAMNTAGLATYNRLGAGMGYSDGESALAVGYQRVLNERGSATFSLNGAFTNSGEQAMGVGVGIGW